MKPVTVYLKAEKNVELQEKQVSLSQIASVFCEDKEMLAKVKSIRVCKEQEIGSRKVISMLEVIALIQTAYPNVEIENIGEADVILTWEEESSKKGTSKEGTFKGGTSKKGTSKKVWDGCKSVFVLLITFFGAAFSTMAFHNDISITRLFSQINTMVLGRVGDGFGVLEISYSIGIVIGILVFFNHFGHKKFSVDPTPIEVEMRKYEDEIQLTLVQNASRKGKEIDVD